MDIHELAKKYEDYMISIRREFHMHPELSLQEERTSRRIQEELKAMGILYEVVGNRNVVGKIEFANPGRKVAFRADIDALPIQEDNDLPYRSTVDGVMHACGHDTHNATLMSLAAILAAHPELVKGTVKFIFQAAEEKIPGGARQLVADGALEGVDTVFAFHSSSALELGKTVVNVGPISAAIGSYEVKVIGKGGHGSDPSKSVNPVPIAAMIASAVNQVKSEKIAPLHAATVTVSYIHGGKYPNVIPGDAVLGGNIRVLDNSDMRKVLDNIKAVSTAIAESWGAGCEFTEMIGYPANVNDREPAELVRSAISEIGYETLTTEPGLGGEDFAYFALEKPSAFFSVGGADPEDPRTRASAHSKDFMLDERMLDIALECELAVYLKATGQA